MPTRISVMALDLALIGNPPATLMLFYNNVARLRQFQGILTFGVAEEPAEVLAVSFEPKLANEGATE